MTTKTMLATLFLMSAAAATAQEVALLEPHAHTARTSGGHDAARPSSITDDGHDADRLLPAGQLVIASLADGAGVVELELRNERGHLVEQRMYPASRTIAVDLGHLKRGRYAARVMREGRVEVCRFTRP